MKTTTNLGLVKPELTDVADITAMNDNWDKIDSVLLPFESDKSSDNVDTILNRVLTPMGDRTIKFVSFNANIKGLRTIWFVQINKQAQNHATAIATGINPQEEDDAVNIVKLKRRYYNGEWGEWFNETTPIIYDTTELTPGTSALETGTLYFVYE